MQQYMIQRCRKLQFKNIRQNFIISTSFVILDILKKNLTFENENGQSKSQSTSCLLKWLKRTD